MKRAVSCVLPTLEQHLVLSGIPVSTYVTFSAETRVRVYSRTAVTMSLPDPLFGADLLSVKLYLDCFCVLVLHALDIPISPNVFVIDCVLVYIGFSSIDYTQRVILN